MALTPTHFWLIGAFCCVVAFVAVWLEARLDRAEGVRGEAHQLRWLYGIVAVVALLPLLSIALSADVPGIDPCSKLEPYSWEWWLIGCYWGGM